MIGVRDFVPADKTKTLALSRTYESVYDMLQRVNAFVAEHDLAVVNIETLLLPVNTQATQFDDSTQMDLGIFEVGVKRQQVLRLWFRKKD